MILSLVFKVVSDVKGFGKIRNEFAKLISFIPTVVEDIHQIIDQKFIESKEFLSTKEDLFRVKAELENKMNDHLKWIMATIIAVGGLIVALIKLI